jgi:hypothetical protein
MEPTPLTVVNPVGHTPNPVTSDASPKGTGTNSSKNKAPEQPF